MNQLGVIATETRGSALIASLDGEFDMSNVHDLRRRITDATSGGTVRRLVVDLAAVTFLDSSTVHLLLGLNDLCHERNIALRISAPPGSRAARVLEMAGAASAVRMSSSLGDALAEG